MEDVQQVARHGFSPLRYSEIVLLLRMRVGCAPQLRNQLIPVLLDHEPHELLFIA